MFIARQCILGIKVVIFGLILHFPDYFLTSETWLKHNRRQCQVLEFAGVPGWETTNIHVRVDRVVS